MAETSGKINFLLRVENHLHRPYPVWPLAGDVTAAVSRLECFGKGVEKRTRCGPEHIRRSRRR